jgi:hypothetical protein
MEQPFQKLAHSGLDMVTGTAFALCFTVRLNDVFVTAILAAIGALVSFCTSMALRRFFRWFKGK